MSHTLIYYKRDASPDPSPERIVEVLDLLPHTARHGEPGHYQFVYTNPATGVEFVLDFSNRRDADREVEEHHFEGLGPAGLTARVDYLRPSFFGLEAMPWLADVRSDLELLILDPQREGGSAAGPEPYATEDLLDSWDASNTRATLTLTSQEGIDMTTGSRAALQAWWHHVMAAPELEGWYGSDVVVSVPRLMRDRRGQAVIVAPWTYPKATVLPAQADRLLLERERRRFAILSVVEHGTVSAERFLGVMPSALRRLDAPHPHILFVPEGLTFSEERAAERIGVNTRADLEPVNPTRLTDVEPAS